LGKKHNYWSVTGRRIRRIARGTSRREKSNHKWPMVLAVSTSAMALFTFLVALGTFITISHQKDFDERQLDLYELSTAPLVFVELDSLRQTGDYNVFYQLRNVGISPAVGVKIACQITPEKHNPFHHEIPAEVTGDIFPGISISSQSKQQYKPEGTFYLHFRVDFQDLRDQKYYYKATVCIQFYKSKEEPGVYVYKGTQESTEYRKLNR